MRNCSVMAGRQDVRMSSTVTLGNIVIDRSRYDVWVENKRIELTYVEFELLTALARSAGKVVTRSRLLQSVWNDAESEDDRKLTVHMSRLRKKLRGSYPWRIETYTKRGYALIDHSPAAAGLNGSAQHSPSDQTPSEQSMPTGEMP